MREKDIRAYVAYGSGMDRRWVMPRLDGPPPPSGVYCTVLFVDEQQRELQVSGINREVPDGVTRSQREHLRTAFSVQWFREGAHAAARRFRAFVMSEPGTWCALTGLGAVREEEQDGWEAFAVVEPLGQVRQLDSIMPRQLMADELTSDEVEERRGVDLLVDWFHDTSHDVGCVTDIDLTVDKIGPLDISRS